MLFDICVGFQYLSKRLSCDNEAVLNCYLSFEKFPSFAMSIDQTFDPIMGDFVNFVFTDCTSTQGNGVSQLSLRYTWRKKTFTM